MDGAGNLLIADTGNNRIRVVAGQHRHVLRAGDDRRGHLHRAGDGTAGFSGDGGPATAAELDGPDGVAVDGAGNLLIADTGNDRIRVVAASTGTFYGQAMTAGDIYTVAGNGTAGSPATAARPPRAELDDPGGVAVDGAGNLVIADTGNNRVRVVAASTGTFYGQAMTAGRHLHRRRQRHRRVLRRRRPGHRAELDYPDGRGRGRRGQPGDRRHRQRPGPGGGGQHRHVLRPADDRRRHLHGRRQRRRGFSGDGGPATAPSSPAR